MTPSAGRALGGIVLRRAFQTLTLLLIIGTLSFLMVRSLPGDMAMRIAAGRYGHDLVSDAASQTVARELARELAGWPALLDWLGKVLRLSLGDSLVTGEPVWRELSHQLGASIRLSLSALGLALLLGLPLGLWCGLRVGSMADRLMLGATVLLRATPPFLLAVLLMMLVAVQMGLLPVAGDGHVHSVFLPGLTLALGLAAGLTRMTRNAMLTVTQTPAWHFARTKGLSDAQVLWRHGLRAIAVPVVSWVGVQAVFLVEGTVVIESLFAWPGIGHALVHAIFARDVPVIQGTALAIGLLFVCFNLLVDALCLWLDPRQRKR